MTASTDRPLEKARTEVAESRSVGFGSDDNPAMVAAAQAQAYAMLALVEEQRTANLIALGTIHALHEARERLGLDQ